MIKWSTPLNPSLNSPSSQGLRTSTNSCIKKSSTQIEEHLPPPPKKKHDVWFLPLFFSGANETPRSWPQKGSYDKNTRWGGASSSTPSAVFPPSWPPLYLGRSHRPCPVGENDPAIGSGPTGVEFLLPFFGNWPTDLPAILGITNHQDVSWIFHKSSRCFHTFSY